MKPHIAFALMLALVPLTAQAQSSNLDKLFGNTPPTSNAPQPAPTPAVPTASTPQPQAQPVAQPVPQQTAAPAANQPPPPAGSDRMANMSVPEQRTVFANCLKSMGISKIRVMTTEETNTLVSCLSK